MKTLLTCSVGSHKLAIDVVYVREIIRPARITPVPGSPSTFSGLLNLRGYVLTVVNAATCLEDTFGVPVGERKIIVLRRYEDLPPEHRAGYASNGVHYEAAGLMVDDIGDIVELQDDQMEPPPANLGLGRLPFVCAVTEIDGTLHAIADIRSLLTWDGLG